MPATNEATPRLTVSCGSTIERLNSPMNRPICEPSTFCVMIANGRLTIEPQPMPTIPISA